MPGSTGPRLAGLIALAAVVWVPGSLRANETLAADGGGRREHGPQRAPEVGLRAGRLGGAGRLPIVRALTRLLGLRLRGGAFTEGTAAPEGGMGGIGALTAAARLSPFARPRAAGRAVGFWLEAARRSRADRQPRPSGRGGGRRDRLSGRPDHLEPLHPLPARRPERLGSGGRRRPDRALRSRGGVVRSQTNCRVRGSGWRCCRSRPPRAPGRHRRRRHPQSAGQVRQDRPRTSTSSRTRTAAPRTTTTATTSPTLATSARCSRRWSTASTTPTAAPTAARSSWWPTGWCWTTRVMFRTERARVTTAGQKILSAVIGAVEAAPGVGPDGGRGPRRPARARMTSTSG